MSNIDRENYRLPYCILFICPRNALIHYFFVNLFS